MFALWCHALVAWGDVGPRVAVLEIRGDLPSAQLSLLSDEVRSGILDVTREMGFVVMSRENMAVLAKDMGLDLSCVEGACEVETGRNLNAAYVVSGHVVRMGGEWICTVKVFDTSKGALLASDRVRARRPNDFLDGLRGLSGKLMQTGLGIQGEGDKDKERMEAAIAQEMVRQEAIRRAEARRAQLEADRAAREAKAAELARQRRAEAERRAEEARLAEAQRAQDAEREAQLQAQRAAEEATRRAAEEARRAEQARVEQEAAARRQAEARGDVNTLGMVMISIPAGQFAMGSLPSEPGRQDDETPHTVTLSRDLVVQRAEVTQKQWREAMGAAPDGVNTACGEACPVTHVSWLDAVRFANAVSELEGLKPAYQIYGSTVAWQRDSAGYRLPTEAEWEYLARAGAAGMYSGGGQVGDVAWTLGAGGPKPVAQKTPNGFGLFDMTGNVHEWCWDLYGPYPADVTDPTGPQVGVGRVFRGGSWRVLSRSARVANRDWMKPELSNDQVGLRLVRTP